MQNDNLFWAGLSVIAGKRFDRDLLVPNDYPLRYRLTGTIGESKITETVKGCLTVSPEQSRSTSTKPKDVDIVAALLYQLPKTKRAKVCATLASDGLTSDTDCATLAKHFVKSLTTVSTQSIRGSIAFSTE